LCHAQKRCAVEGFPPDAPQCGTRRQLRGLLFQPDGHDRFFPFGKPLPGGDRRFFRPDRNALYSDHHFFEHISAQQYQNPRMVGLYHSASGIAYSPSRYRNPRLQLLRFPRIRYVVRNLPESPISKGRNRLLSRGLRQSLGDGSLQGRKPAKKHGGPIRKCTANGRLRRPIIDIVELDDTEFGQQFENGTLPPALFDHLGHLRMAWIYLKSYGESGAIEKACGDIRAYARIHGDVEKFHKTLTVASIKIVNHFVKRTET